MEELQLKYVEIIFDKQTPQNIGAEINISSKIDNCEGKLEYKFIVGKGGIWNTIQEFSEKSECVWMPKSEGEYMVMVQARDKDGKKPLDYLAKEGYSIISEEETGIIQEEILSPKVVNDGEGDINFKGILEDEVVFNNVEFKEVMNIQEDNVVFLEVKELSKYEEEILMAENDVKEKQPFAKDIGRIEYEKINSEEKELNIINDVITNKEEYVVGEKCSVEVKTNNDNAYLYRFYIKNNDEWDIIRDYDTSGALNYTVNEEGEKELLIQCKRMESTEAFEDYKIIKVNVKSINKIEITEFKCLNKSLIAGEKLEFIVKTNICNNEAEKDKFVLLYKFYKLYKDGRSICIQDYSTKNDVYYKELEAGNYRILCLAKNIFSNKEYDDRAVLVYNVKPYKDIKINSFVASLNSPQTTETDIKFTSEIQGGKNILYRYKVRGPIEDDTGFMEEKEFSWKPIEAKTVLVKYETKINGHSVEETEFSKNKKLRFTPKIAGKYTIEVYAKNIKCKGEYDSKKQISLYVSEASPIIETKIITNKLEFNVNEEVTFEVVSRGGKDICYEFYLMRNNEWKKVQTYSKKHYYSFIPFTEGKYKILALAKSYYKKVSYEDYDQITFYVKGLKK
jgi:hypothetical protein